MRIKITTTFTDLEAKDHNHAEVVAGTIMTVTAERGAQLIDLRLADPLDEASTKSPTPTIK